MKIKDLTTEQQSNYFGNIAMLLELLRAEDTKGYILMTVLDDNVVKCSGDIPLEECPAILIATAKQIAETIAKRKATENN